MTAGQLQLISTWLGEHAASETLESAIRAAFPGFHFTFCSDDDVVADVPVAAGASFNLYLVDSAHHCLCLTSDMDAASGLVVAAVEVD